MSNEPNASQGAGPSQELTAYLLKLLNATDEELAGPLKEFADKFVEEFEKSLVVLEGNRDLSLDRNPFMEHKQCAGCGALLPVRKPMCPHCHSYRFDL